MKKFILSLCLISCFTALISAQAARTITGVVVDNLGDPLIGATIMAENSDVGTVTDIDGKFSLDVPAGIDNVELSYTGYANQTADISEVSDLLITLEDDIVGLDEVVVTGYQPVRRKDLVGSVSTVSGEDLNKEAGATAQSALRRASGVVVQQSSGTPGAGFNVRIRGATSITASNEPLYVVDGVPVATGSFAQNDIGGQGSNALADLNMNDVESIEVLKDASTTAIYGSRAANGVVLITTKKGQAGTTKIDVNAGYGWNSPVKKIDIVDNRDYQNYVEERYGTRNLLALDPGLDSNANSNWQDSIFDTAPIKNVGVSISGGDVKTKFFSSLNYDNNKGIVRNSEFERYNGRINLNHTANDKLIADLNIAYNYSKNRRVQNDNNIFGAVSSSILLPPTVPTFNPDGTYGSAFGLENPVAAITAYDNLLKTNRVIGSGSLSYLPTSFLKLTARLGIDALDLRETVFQPSVLQSVPSGSISEASTRNIRLLNEFLVTYTGDYGSTQLVALGGAIFQRNTLDQTLFVETDVPDNTPSGNAAATPATVLGDITEDVLQSYIASANLSFAGNLFVTASFRADGSSRFINDRWGFFPGVAVGYDFADRVEGFSQLKLRASYGQTGNNNVDDFAARQLYSGFNNYLNSPGTAPSQIGNVDLRWETTETIDLGIDVTLLENRISASFGVYQKNTTDLLLDRPLPTSSGFEDVLQNIGEIRNRGFEASLTLVPIQTKEFGFRNEITVAYNENEVISLFDDQPFDRGFATRVAVGQPLGAFFGYVTDGIFQDSAEVFAGPRPPAPEGEVSVGPGDIRYKDLNGDGIINDEDRDFIGQALPKWTGGINNVFNWRGFEVSAFFQFNLGNDVYNNNINFAEGLNSVFAPTQRAFDGAWREGSATNGNKFPRIGGGDIAVNNRRDGNRFIEDGSFVRLKTASISYTLGSEVFGESGVRSARLYVQGTNLINWNNYSWYDPEVNTFGGDNVALGTDFLSYPQARTIQVGLNLGF